MQKIYLPSGAKYGRHRYAPPQVINNYYFIDLDVTQRRSSLIQNVIEIFEGYTACTKSAPPSSHETFYTHFEMRCFSGQQYTEGEQNSRIQCV